MVIPVVHPEAHHGLKDGSLALAGECMRCCRRRQTEQTAAGARGRGASLM